MKPPGPDPSSWPRPRGLLLDAMGTLIGLRASVGHTYADLAAEHGLSVDAAAIDEAFPAVLRQAPPLAFPGLEGDDLLAAERGWWARRIDTVLAAARRQGATKGEHEEKKEDEDEAFTAPPALHRALFDRFADASLWRVYPDVPAALLRWHTAGLRLAVVSNFDGRLPALLNGLGLADRFERVVVSSSAGAAKPSPVPFRIALESLRLLPSEAWHIGDSPEDGRGATAAGLRCLLVRRP